MLHWTPEMGEESEAMKHGYVSQGVKIEVPVYNEKVMA